MINLTDPSFCSDKKAMPLDSQGLFGGGGRGGCLGGVERKTRPYNRQYFPYESCRSDWFSHQDKMWLVDWNQKAKDQDVAFAYIPEKVLAIDFGMGKHNWKCLWFVSMIQLGYFRGKRGQEFISISKAQLRKFFGARIELVKQRLAELGVIEIDHTYLDSKLTKDGVWKYKGYKLNKKLRGNVKKVAIRHEPLANRLKIMRNKSWKASKEKSPTAAALVKNLEAVTIDHEKAMNHVKREGYKGKKADYYNFAIDSLHNQELYAVVDKRTGRFFHNIANLPRDVRQFLSYQGKKLVEVDVSCCQPLLLSSLYPKDDEAAESERKRYLEVIDNDFYGFFAKEAGMERDKVKNAIFTDVFFDKVHEGRLLWLQFNFHFPILAEIIRKIKYNDHTQLALKLQGLEAEGMIEGACKKLCQNEIFAIPIHDSILCVEEDVPLVHDTISAEMSRVARHKPIIKIKKH